MGKPKKNKKVAILIVELPPDFLGGDMSKKILVTFLDRLDREFFLVGEEGQLLADVLLKYHIPFDAVLAYKNGVTTSEFDLRVNSKDVITVKMVRAYQLTDFLTELGIWPSEKNIATPSKPNVYHKGILWFGDEGQAELVNRPILEEEFSAYLEDAFIQSIMERNLISEGETIGLALSGGRDSLALLYLLIKTRRHLPNFKIVSATVCENSSTKDVQIAKEAAETLGIERKFISVEEIQTMFSLKVTMEDALFQILERHGKTESINCAHAYMRTCIERYFSSRGIAKVAFGLHNEDLLAALFKSMANGIPFGETLWQKSWGQFQFIYPLWAITKKELTIYLELVAPEVHNSQGSPAHFDRGGMNRDIQYFLADSVQTLWPGFSFHAFDGYSLLMRDTNFAKLHHQCPHCKGFYYAENQQEERICHLCEHLFKLNQVE